MPAGISKRLDFRGRESSTIINAIGAELGIAPEFSAPLVSSLIPEVGSGAYTFARASTASIFSHDGNIYNCVANEARFANARRVENLLRNANAKSNNINDGVWVGNTGSETINGPNQYTETVGSANAGILATGIFAGNDGRAGTFVVSFGAYKVSGTSNAYAVRLICTSGVNASSPTLTLTGSLQRFSVELTTTDVGTSVDLLLRAGVSESGRIIHIEDIQVEYVDGQLNKNPSEIVSYGMGDEHGCGVDGVKWFSYVNGNTVAANIVTFANGAAFSSTPRGYRPEQEKINRAWPSEGLNSANWTKVNVAAPIPTPTVLIAGDVVGNTIKASSTSDVSHHVDWSLTTTSANQDVACAIFIKKGTVDHVFIRCVKGAESAAQFFNVNTGAIGSVQTSGGAIVVRDNHTAIHTINNGYWVHLVFNCSATPGAHTFEFGVANADNALTFAAANTTDILMYLSGGQVQSDHEIGCYIRTVSGEVTKAGDQLFYTVPDVPANKKMSVIADYWVELPDPSNSIVAALWDSTAPDSGYYLELRSTSIARISQGDATGATTYTAPSSAILAGTIQTLGAAFSLNADERFASIDGVTLTPTINTDDATSWAIDTFGVGCFGAAGQPDSVIANVKLYHGLTQSELNAITA